MIKYFKNIYYIEFGIEKLKDERKRPKYKTGKVILPLVSDFYSGSKTWIKSTIYKMILTELELTGYEDCISIATMLELHILIGFRGIDMRIKSVKSMENRILKSSRYIKDPFKHKWKWVEFFGNNNKIHMELGMGKGDFIIETALRNPYINYIGIEKYHMVIARAAGKLENTDINNVALLVQDIDDIKQIVPEGSIDRIYLNFLDPWPKKKHEKRRCTNTRFLEKYYSILANKGEIHIKTDNSDFFEYTLEKIKESAFDIFLIIKDLYSTEHIKENVQTEYEKKFVSQGSTIKKVVAVKNI